MPEKAKIPKLIHYCWFRDANKPETIKRCITSWKIHLQDYKFIEWNDRNFDVYSNRYAEEAYETRNFKSLSDYIKFHALYQYGGIYIDADVEVFKPFDDLLRHESFWGFEENDFIATSTIGTAKGNRLIKLFLDQYRHKRFIKKDGSFNDLTGTELVTKVLEEIGLNRNGKYQKITEAGTFYPKNYFSSSENSTPSITKETYAFHHLYSRGSQSSGKLGSFKKRFRKNNTFKLYILLENIE